MFYRNLQVYRITDSGFNPAAADMEPVLESRQFRPCGAHDSFSGGFVAPVDGGDVLARVTAPNIIAICYQREEKVLPSSALNEELAKRIEALELKEARKIAAKERSRMKDELIFEILPRAMTVSKRTHGYIDIGKRWVVIDAPSPKKAEEFLSELRKALVSLPVVPISTRNKPSGIMTGWVTGAAKSDPFSIGDNCELRGIEEGGAIVRCKNLDLESQTVKDHIEQQGMVVHKLALNYQDRESFTLTADWQIKGIRFLDIIVQEAAADGDYEGRFDVFDADHVIMTAEVSALISKLVAAFGGYPDASPV